MSVTLSVLLGRLPASTSVAGDREIEFTSLDIDSRNVERGSLFVAVRGEHVDGHDFVRDAIARGATAVVAESGRRIEGSTGATIVYVPDSRRALSSIAAAFYRDPSHALDVLGVTGTNGKTTTTHMIAAILKVAGPRVRDYRYRRSRARAYDVAPFEHDAAAAGASRAARADARSRCERGRDGSEFARARARSRRGYSLPCRRADERYARPFGLSPNARSVCRRKAPALHDVRSGGAQPRRRTRRTLGRRGSAAYADADVLAAWRSGFTCTQY